MVKYRESKCWYCYDLYWRAAIGSTDKHMCAVFEVTDDKLLSR